MENHGGAEGQWNSDSLCFSSDPEDEQDFTRKEKGKNDLAEGRACANAWPWDGRNTA